MTSPSQRQREVLARLRDGEPLIFERTRVVSRGRSAEARFGNGDRVQETTIRALERAGRVRLTFIDEVQMTYQNTVRYRVEVA